MRGAKLVLFAALLGQPLLAQQNSELGQISSQLATRPPLIRDVGGAILARAEASSPQQAEPHIKVLRILLTVKPPGNAKDLSRIEKTDIPKLEQNMFDRERS